jgi:DNA-binding transcriptional regulator LsrR (DeoR family)
MVRRHAEELLDSVLKNDNLTAETIGVGWGAA